MVVLEQQASAPAQLRPIHPADAVVAMMGETMDALRFGPQAVDVLCTLVARNHS